MRVRLSPAVLLALLLLPLAPRPAALAADDPDARQREFLERVNDAIDRGVLWLVDQQREDGSWAGYDDQYPMGMTALGLLTVLKCDYPRDSAVLKKAKKLLHERWKEQKPSRLRTYSVAILVMALEEQHASRDPVRKEKNGRYGNAREIRRVNLPAPDYDWMKKLTKWMLDRQTETIWRYPGGGIDLSNTQYALLGLAAASRCGLTLPNEPFVRAAKHLIETQEKQGPQVRRVVHADAGPGYATRTLTDRHDYARGWGYRPGGRATGSMTTAGVSSLAICRSELLGNSIFTSEFAGRTERAIHDGLAWLNVNFSVKQNPRAGWAWHYYYLFGLERSGVLADTRFLGDHDWYREGAEYLVARQSRHGSWNPGRGGRRRPGASGLTDTCFALLFLRRATVPVRVPRAITPGPEER